MAWDTEATRHKLLAAATQEFAAHGYAGARVDRIAANAGVNKQRIYSYFGDKDGLFEVVLGDGLAELFGTIPLEGEGPDAVADHAAAMFDFFGERPGLARLLCWEGLERADSPAAAALRARGCGGKIEAMRRVLPGASRQDAADLVLSVTTLVVGWHGLSQLDGLMAGDLPRTAALRRASVAAAARGMAEAVARG